MTTNENQSQLIGPVLALDLGEKLVGAAVSDERLVTTKRLQPLKRSNWKKLLQDVRDLLERFDAQTIVVGLPLRMDGTEGDAAKNVRRLALNLARSVQQPVYLQDERLTSVAATENLKAEGLTSRRDRGTRGWRSCGTDPSGLSYRLNKTEYASIPNGNRKQDNE